MLPILVPMCAGRRAEKHTSLRCWGIVASEAVLGSEETLRPLEERGNPTYKKRHAKGDTAGALGLLLSAELGPFVWPRCFLNFGRI